MKTAAIVLSCVCLPWAAACGDTASSAGEIPVYTVTTSASFGGTLNASKTTVLEGQSVSFEMIGNVGYVLASFTVNGGEVSVSETVIENADKTFTYTYSWIAPAVLRNYNVVATFVESNAEVAFVSGDGATQIENKAVAYGEIYGALASPVCAGKRFDGWFDEDGKKITPTSIVNKSGTIVLTAKWTEVTEEEKAGLAPYSLTSTYYDAAATKYGVMWHTETEPIAPVVQVIKVTDPTVEPDFSVAETMEATGDYFEWVGCDEYVSKAVVENLEFATDYAVRLGDKVADVWSDTFRFTTRAETVDEFSFLYVADSQESPSIEYQREGIYIGDTYWSQVMREATVRFPDAHFIAHGGDMVNYGAIPMYWEEMLGSVEEYLFDMPIVFTTGNHEGQWYAANREVTNMIFNVDCSVEYAGDRGFYYSFDYGPMHFMVLRSNDILYGDGVLTTAQMEWIKADLAKAKANPNVKWTVAMIHEGPLSPSFSGSGSNSHQNTHGPQTLPYITDGVDLVLYGHEHNFITTYPVVWDDDALPDNAGNHLAVVTNETTVEKYDGEDLNVFKFPEGTTKRGTVFYQTGTVGMQWQSGYKLATMQSVLDRTNLRGLYRYVLSGHSGCIDNKHRSMYGYVEVSGDEIVVRTYGASVKDIAAETDETKLAQHTIYLDGFALRK